jgi:hypothetical protein
MSTGVHDIRTRVLTVVATSLGLVVSLALNKAFQETFNLIPISSNTKVGNAWIYVMVVGFIVVLALWGIMRLQAERSATLLSDDLDGDEVESGSDDALFHAALEDSTTLPDYIQK